MTYGCVNGWMTIFFNDLPGVSRNHKPRPHNRSFWPEERGVFGFVHTSMWWGFGVHWTFWYWMVLVGSTTFWVVEVKKEKFNRLHNAIVPYITENLWPYVMWPPIRSRGDWGQSQFQLGGDDESTHQTPSNGLLFLTFYHFPYTTGPPTSTMPMQPSPTIVQSPLTIPITPSVWYHIRDLPYDLRTTLLYFPFLVSFLSPNAFCRGLTNHRSSHCTVGTLPYVSPHMNLVLVLLIICIQDFCIYSKKNKEVFPRTQT